MSAPRVRVGAGWLILFRPSGKPQSNHVSPRLQQTDVFVPHASVFQRAGEIEPKIIGGLRHLRQWAVDLESRVASRKNLHEHRLLLSVRYHVKPDTKKVRVLAEMLLRRGVGEQAIFLIPAERAYALRSAADTFPIRLRSLAVAEGILHFCCGAKRLDKLQRDHGRTAVIILRWLAKIEVACPVYKNPPGQLLQQAVGPLALQEPVEHSAGAGELRSHKTRVSAVQPEVMHHTDP